MPKGVTNEKDLTYAHDVLLTPMYKGFKAREVCL